MRLPSTLLFVCPLLPLRLLKHTRNLRGEYKSCVFIRSERFNNVTRWHFQVYRSIHLINVLICRSRWPRGLRRRSAAARLLGLWVRIPPGAWMSVSCECCVLSGTGLCDRLITRPEESYRLWCVAECDLETSRMRRPWPTGGCCAKRRRRRMVLYSDITSFIFPTISEKELRR